MYHKEELSLLFLYCGLTYSTLIQGQNHLEDDKIFNDLRNVFNGGALSKTAISAHPPSHFSVAASSNLHRSSSPGQGARCPLPLLDVPTRGFVVWGGAEPVIYCADGGWGATGNQSMTAGE